MLNKNIDFTILRRLSIPNKQTFSKYQGLTRSKNEGEGYDLYGIRLFKEGDSVKKIDWNATARTNQLHIKSTHSEVNVPVYIYTDQSPSMTYGFPRTKQQTADIILDALCQVALNSQNPVSLITNANTRSMTPLSGKKKTNEYVLGAIKNNKNAGTDEIGAKLLSSISRPSIPAGSVVVISDFLDSPKLIESLKKIANRHQVTTVRIYDPTEYALPDKSGFLYLRNLENGKTSKIFINPKIASNYNKIMADKLDDLNSVLQKIKAYPVAIGTDSDISASLNKYFNESKINLLERQKLK